MDINLELYKVFYHVVRSGSISRASQELFISQPAVSQSIRQLESKLGGRLFSGLRRVSLLHLKVMSCTSILNRATT